MSQQKTVLRQVRRARDITLAVLARDTGIAESKLSTGERGLTAFTPEQQDALSKYFDVPAERLFAIVADEAVA